MIPVQRLERTIDQSHYHVDWSMQVVPGSKGLSKKYNSVQTIHCKQRMVLQFRYESKDVSLSIPSGKNNSVAFLKVKFGTYQSILCLLNQHK